MKVVLVMAVRQVRQSEWTKDGRKWIFEVRYKDFSNKVKSFKSKKYLTKKEAQSEERKFLLKVDNISFDNKMTFSELCNSHFEYQKDKVKVTTLRNYRERRQNLTLLDNIKLVDLNINHFEKWKEYINSKGWSTAYKNDLYKYLKSILNYGMKWYDFNFTTMYRKMTNFNNPNEMKKEMLFWTFNEFKKFISVESDIKFKTIYETLYYCGLRSGEVRGLTWDNIDFKENTLSVKKNIVINFEGTKFVITTPKTKSSYRTIPMPKVLVEDLKILKEKQNDYYGFSEDWFVFGSDEPIGKSVIGDRKNKNCKLAGVKQIRIHDFRHSCASLLIDKGANIVLVAKYLGHAKIDETLNTYSHMYKSRLDDIVQTIDDMNN